MSTYMKYMLPMGMLPMGFLEVTLGSKEVSKFGLKMFFFHRSIPTP